MKIGIDIDNTIAPTFNTIINFMNKKYTVKKKRSHSKDPSAFDLYHTDFNLFYKDWVEFLNSDKHHDMKPINGSVRVIKKLNKKHQIYIITARNSKHRKNTVLWIEKNYKEKFEEIHFIDYNHEDYTKPFFTKGDIVKRLGIDVVIEDNLNEIRDIAKKNPKTKLFLFDKNNQYTWNKERPLPKNTMKIESWKDFEREMEKLEHKTI